MKPNNLVEILAGVRVLHGVSQKHLEQIAAVAEVLDLKESDVMFREGEVAESLYLVASGQLELELAPSTMECKHLVTVGPGEMLGWSSLAEQPRFAATAVAIEPTRLIRVSASRLQQICIEDPQFAYEFMRRVMLALAKRLATTWKQLSELQVAHFVPTPAFQAKRSQ